MHFCTYPKGVHVRAYVRFRFERRRVCMVRITPS